MRLGWLVCAVLLLFPSAGWAEWQLRPFLGLTFGGDNTLLDLDQVAGERKFMLGISGTWLGNFVGVEGDVARVPGFFQTVSQQSVNDSSVTMYTANVVLTLPKKMTQYGLRPYFVAGGGAVRARSNQEVALLDVDTTLKVFDIGGGATGFLSDRIGLSWDVRYFRSVGGKEGTGLSIGKEEISFWRASMGVAIRLGAVR